MIRIIIPLFLNIVLLVQNSFAQVDTTRLRPSYRDVYSRCLSNKKDFKEKFLIEVYQTATFSATMSVLGDFSSANSLISTRGLTPKMYVLLNSETFSAAIKDCFGSIETANNFIAKLLFVESLGKFVGVSLGSAAIYGLGKVVKTIFHGLKNIVPAAVYKKIVVGTIIFGSAISLDMIRKQYSEEDLSEFPNNSNDNLDSWKKNVVTKGLEQLRLIEEQLQDPDLSAEDRQQVLKLKTEWTTTLSKFK